MDYIEMEEGQAMRQRVLGLVCFCIGFGMVLAIIVPALGWVFYGKGMLKNKKVYVRSTYTFNIVKLCSCN